MFTFTDQPKESAVVPMLIGALGGEWNQPPLHDRIIPWNIHRPNVLASPWLGVWGAYRYTDQRGRPCHAEAWGMVNPQVQDFCGGTLFASVGCAQSTVEDSISWNPGEQQVLLRRGTSRYGLYTQEWYDSLPDMSTALAQEHALTKETVRSCLLRSVALWIMAYGRHRRRQSMLGYDVCDGHLTAAAEGLRECRVLPDRCVYTNVNNLCPMVLDGDPSETAPEWDDELLGEMWAREIRPVISLGPEFENKSSGRTCHTVQAVANSTGRYLALKLPEWWTKAARTLGYQRMFPRDEFSH